MGIGGVTETLFSSTLCPTSIYTHTQSAQVKTCPTAQPATKNTPTPTSTRLTHLN